MEHKIYVDIKNIFFKKTLINISTLLYISKFFNNNDFLYICKNNFDILYNICIYF